MKYTVYPTHTECSGDSVKGLLLVSPHVASVVVEDKSTGRHVPFALAPTSSVDTADIYTKKGVIGHTGTILEESDERVTVVTRDGRVVTSKYWGIVKKQQVTSGTDYYIEVRDTKPQQSHKLRYSSDCMVWQPILNIHVSSKNWSKAQTVLSAKIISNFVVSPDPDLNISLVAVENSNLRPSGTSSGHRQAGMTMYAAAAPQSRQQEPSRVAKKYDLGVVAVSKGVTVIPIENYDFTIADLLLADISSRSSSGPATVAAGFISDKFLPSSHCNLRYKGVSFELELPMYQVGDLVLLPMNKSEDVKYDSKTTKLDDNTLQIDFVVNNMRDRDIKMMIRYRPDDDVEVLDYIPADMKGISKQREIYFTVNVPALTKSLLNISVRYIKRDISY